MGEHEQLILLNRPDSNSLISKKVAVTATSLDIQDNATREDLVEIGQALARAEAGVQWWIGDWWNTVERSYGEGMEMCEKVGIDYGYARNLGYVAREMSLRSDKVSFAHHQALAPLPAPEQEKWLTKAADGEWSVSRLRQEMKWEPFEKGTPPIPEGTYDVIYADPPWPYDNQIESWGPTDLHYPAMSMDDILALPVPMLAPSDATLFMWVTNPFVEDAFSVINAWGFEYKTNAVWVKTGLKRPGSGFYVRGHHELLFICTRGNHVPNQNERKPISSVITADLNEHSAKPEQIYEFIENMYPHSRRLELFNRGKARNGWTGWGNESE